MILNMDRVEIKDRDLLGREIFIFELDPALPMDCKRDKKGNNKILLLYVTHDRAHKKCWGNYIDTCP